MLKLLFYTFFLGGCLGRADPIHIYIYDHICTHSINFVIFPYMSMRSMCISPPCLLGPSQRSTRSVPRLRPVLVTSFDGGQETAGAELGEKLSADSSVVMIISYNFRFHLVF